MSLIDTLQGFTDAVYSDLLVRFLLAAVIILLGFVIGRMAGKVSHRVLHEIELNRLVKGMTGKEVSLEELVGHAVSYIIYFFVIIMALNQLGLTTTLLYIISSAIIIIIIFSFLLAVKDFIPNMFAGLSLQKRAFLKKGDVIVFKGMEGKVDQVNLTETRIITKKKDIISIPNGTLLQHEIVKKSRK